MRKFKYLITLISSVYVLTSCGTDRNNSIVVENNAPVIINSGMSPDPVKPGSIATAYCNAIDADDDSLTYKWSSDDVEIDPDEAVGKSHINFTVPETVGQYINLTDKNGKEIYFGDIVIADWCYVEPTEVKFPDIYYDTQEYLQGEDLEVIGNKFENLELLNKK